MSTTLKCITRNDVFKSGDLIKVINANGGGDLYIKSPDGAKKWIHADEAYELFGEGYCNNSNVSKMISNDYDAAMRQCTNP